MQGIRFAGDTLSLLDQTLLPGAVVWNDYRDYRPVAADIVRLAVRGAPAIGVAAAYAYALACRAGDNLEEAFHVLADTRPTAVNLFWALERMADRRRRHGDAPGLYEALREEASRIHEEDIAQNTALSQAGASVVPPGAGILTHCNAGELATGGVGTALGVILQAHREGRVRHVYVDETRPLLQGARLTALELRDAQVPCTLICDNMAAALMRQGEVDLVIVGGDRVAGNGDVANKIGTYGCAVSAHHHGIPFYAAVPGTTLDSALPDGDGIVIEQRDPEEVLCHGGKRLAPEGVPVWNPAFDVTPHRLVTGLITEKGVIYPPFRENIRALFGGGA